MNRINPFDLSLNQGIQKAGSTNAPEKISHSPNQENEQNVQGIGDFKKADENTMIDSSSMIDDTEGFDMSSFDSEEKTNNISSNDKASESEQGKNGDNNNEKEKEEMMAHFEEAVNNFFDKKPE